MPNDRLGTAMLERGITSADLAVTFQVDPNSVERWTDADNAEQDIGVLVYSGLFLAEDAGIQRIFRRTSACPVPAPRRRR